MWSTGILFSSLFLLGVSAIGLLLRHLSKQFHLSYEAKLKQMAGPHDSVSLTQNWGDLILLLDQPLGVPAEKERAAEPSHRSPEESPKAIQPDLSSGENSSGGESPSGQNEEQKEDLPEALHLPRDGVKFLVGNRKTLEAEGTKAYQDIIQDIENTERQLTQIELSNSKRRYRIVSEFASDWTYWQGSDREMLYVSPACQEITGYPAQEFYKEPDLLGTLIHPADRSLWASHNAEELGDKSPTPIEFRIHTHEQEVRWVSHFCKPVQDHNGKFVGVCGSNRDITGQKRAEEAVRIKTEELLQSNAELEQFAYVASHDLQTPLRAISGYLNLLTKRYGGKLDSEADRFIQRTIENTNRMQGLINDLLTLSRLTTRGHPFVPTDCNRALQEVLEMLQPAIEESGGRVTHGALPTVLGDGSQMTQLFQNLIGNAIKFRDHRPPQVYIDAQRAEKAWLFSVKDNGIGIDPQYADRIFLIFQRLHTMDQYPGTGIGLAICKKIVERHGGRIWVESKVGEGSTFKFIIPDQGGNPS